MYCTNFYCCIIKLRMRFVLLFFYAPSITPLMLIFPYLKDHFTNYIMRATWKVSDAVSILRVDHSIIHSWRILDSILLCVSLTNRTQRKERSCQRQLNNVIPTNLQRKKVVATAVKRVCTSWTALLQRRLTTPMTVLFKIPKRKKKKKKTNWSFS